MGGWTGCLWPPAIPSTPDSSRQESPLLWAQGPSLAPGSLGLSGSISPFGLVGLSSLFSHAVCFAPCIHPSGRKVPKLMFSRKVRAVARPSGTPSRAMEGSGSGSEQGASSRAAWAQTPRSIPAVCFCAPQHPSQGSAHPEGPAAWFCVPCPHPASASTPGPPLW